MNNNRLVENMRMKYDKKLVLTGEDITLFHTKTQFLHVHDYWRLLDDVKKLVQKTRSECEKEKDSILAKACHDAKVFAKKNRELLEERTRIREEVKKLGVPPNFGWNNQEMYAYGEGYLECIRNVLKIVDKEKK